MRARVRHIERIATVTIGLALALLINCGGDDDSSDFAGGTSDGGSSGTGSSSSGGSSSGVSFGDGGATASARGVLLVHAAGFPSMRLCFSNYGTSPPQPDRKVLPQANVVGIELGGVVRLGPIENPPGEVIVIQQRKVEAIPGTADEPSCEKYLKTHKADENVEWWRAGSITRPVGVDKAEVIAITGCGPSTLLSQLKIPPSEWQRNCGDDYTGDKTATGTFATQVFSLSTSFTTTASALPMSLVNMAPLVKVPAGQTLDVTFGDFDAGPTAPLATTIPVAPDLYTEGPGVTLNLVQGPGQEASFGLTGFRIAYRNADGGAPLPDAGGFVVNQTLAAIQASSRADGNPTTYYVAASNFTFFLLGDPRVQSTFIDGGTNPNFDSRRAVHLLAVPVHDDSETEPLGGDAGAPTDASDAGDAGVK